MEHILNKALFAILSKLTCFLEEKSAFHTCTPNIFIFAIGNVPSPDILKCHQDSDICALRMKMFCKLTEDVMSM